MKFTWKTILVHLTFWGAYIILWGIHDTAYAPTFWDTLDGNLIGSATYAVGVYLNLYVLLPKLLLKGEKVPYVISVATLVIANSLLTSKALSWHYQDIHPDTSHFFNTWQGLANTGSDFMVVYGMSTCLFLIVEWYRKDKRIHELENRNLKAELDLLKGQINPHFLFNALNSIHVLIRKDKEKAQQTLEKFSDLLSHQIYDVSRDKISLEQEVKSLDNFIQLQQMRHEDHVKVNWNAKGDFVGKSISPMLFLNFVENAFKHGESKGNGQVKIDILIALHGDRLEFACVNSVNKVINGHKKLGLGINNVRRRLDLIYPRQHDLQIEEQDDVFSVYLTLELNEN